MLLLILMCLGCHSSPTLHICLIKGPKTFLVQAPFFGNMAILPICSNKQPCETKQLANSVFVQEGLQIDCH